jgi:hypothetical protein
MPVDPKPPQPPTPKSLFIEDLSKVNRIVRFLAWLITKLM